MTALIEKARETRVPARFPVVKPTGTEKLGDGRQDSGDPRRTPDRLPARRPEVTRARCAGRAGRGPSAAFPRPEDDIGAGQLRLPAPGPDEVTAGSRALWLQWRAQVHAGSRGRYLCSMSPTQPEQNGSRSVTRPKLGRSGNGWRLTTVTAASPALKESVR